MRGLRSLSSGVLIGLGITATVFAALILSVREPLAASISELPIPTVTLQTVFVSPTPLPGASTRPLSPQPSAVGPQSPTPASTLCPIPADWQRYSVGPFDTVASIAQRFNLAPDQLVQANCLGKAVVTVGQTVYVPGFRPTPSASAPCFPPPNWSRYFVQPGDTLSSIAARYGISVYTLMRANCLSTTFIYYGQALYVPPTGPIVVYTPPPIFPTFTPPPSVTAAPPTITAEPPTITVEPPTITVEPPTITAEPPTVTSEPPPITVEPPTITTEPPTVTSEPPPITAEPLPSITSEPPVNTPAPPVSTPLPSVNTPLPPVNTPLPPVNTPAPPGNTPAPSSMVTTLL